MPGYKGHLAGGAVAAGVRGCIGLADTSRTHRLWLSWEDWCCSGAFSDGHGFQGPACVLLDFAVLDLALIVQELYRWAALIGFVATFPAIGSHRGWTHTWGHARRAPASDPAAHLAVRLHPPDSGSILRGGRARVWLPPAAGPDVVRHQPCPRGG